MFRTSALILFGVLSLAGVRAANAQAPAASDAVKAMLGAWELSNADHDKSCMVTFKIETAGSGRAIELDKSCLAAFPIIRDIAAWTLGKDDALRLIDGKGKVLLELTEVENGLFESVHSGDSLYFLQTAAAAQGREHMADDMFGDWAVVRGTGKPICQLTLLNTAADTENFAITVRPGCDPLITSFAPRAWRMDRGQFVLLSSRPEVWRFEEGEPMTWRRIPEGRQPLLLVRQ